MNTTGSTSGDVPSTDKPRSFLNLCLTHLAWREEDLSLREIHLLLTLTGEMQSIAWIARTLGNKDTQTVATVARGLRSRGLVHTDMRGKLHLALSPQGVLFRSLIDASIQSLATRALE